MEGQKSKYKFIKIIGTGSFGEVWKGKCGEKDVAIKLIPRVRTDPKTLKHECDILRSLKHPNIIQMYDSYETDHELVVVTEYVKESLYSLLKKNFLKEGKLLPSDQVHKIMCNLVSALHYLHSRRIFHRDIKPHNILINKYGLAKLCDFGFARKISLDVYVLTSVKGTPLYMAPEVIGEKTYDQSADLWSLGCILYEMLTGTPPYSTNSLAVLKNMVLRDPIHWPKVDNRITNEALSLLQGLLEKNPKKRLTWPALLKHDYVVDGVFVLDEINEGLSAPLTKALSPSQELAKEKQREILEHQIIMKGCRDDLVMRRIHKTLREGRGMFPRTPLPSPNYKYLQGPIPNQNGYPRPSTSNGFALQPDYFCPYYHDGKKFDDAWPPQQRLQAVSPIAVPGTNQQLLPQPQQKSWRKPNEDQQKEVNDDSSGSSCETLTSSSDSEDSEDDDGKTVILENSNVTAHKEQIRNGVLKKENLYLHKDLTKLNLRDRLTNCNSPDKYNNASDLLKSEAVFTLHSFGSEDKPIESDEWVEFLTSTTKEAAQTPTILCEKHFLTMIVAPLRNHLAGTIVIEKIADLLAMPFTNQETNCLDLTKNLETFYLDTKVVPNLLYACKLIVRRRRIARNSSSVDLTDIAANLTEEDLNGMDKCLRLICFLVYSEPEFVVQFCDSVCVLQACIILQIFFNLDKRKSRITTQTLAILSHVLRTIPSNVSIMEDLLLDENNELHELWRLLPHTNPLIQSKSLRILAYLIIHSPKIKEQLVQNKHIKLMLILRNASSHHDPEVKAAATLVIQNLGTTPRLSANKQSEMSMPSPTL